MDMAVFEDPAFWMLVLFVIPLLIRVPIALSLGIAALVVVWKWDMGFEMLSYNFYAGIAKFPLLAIPFFILAGYIMERAGIAARIVALMETLVGSMTGGLAVATVAVATFWGAVSGSGPATVAALGLILIPGMARAGYDKPFAAATVSVTSGLAIVIPPSIAFIVYGGVTNVSVPALFAAGFIPGVIVALFIMGAVLIISHRRGYRGMKTGVPLGRAFRDAFWGVMTPVVILGGIYGGYFTPTEAAVIAIFYSIFVGLFIHRELTFTGIRRSLQTTSWMTGRVLIIMFTAYAFERLLVQYRIPDMLVERVLGITTDVTVVWMFVVAVLLFLGMFMETLAIILLVTPVMLPIMTAFGVDPIHFGVVLVCCCGVGFSTPPLGENMFIASGIADTTLEDISFHAFPFVCVTVGVILLCVFVPDIVLFLPRMAM